MIKFEANLTEITVRYSENPFTGNFDADVSLMLDGVIYATRRIATRQMQGLRGNEEIFNELVEEARYWIVKMLKTKESV